MVLCFLILVQICLDLWYDGHIVAVRGFMAEKAFVKSYVACVYTKWCCGKLDFLYLILLYFHK